MRSNSRRMKHMLAGLDITSMAVHYFHVTTTINAVQLYIEAIRGIVCKSQRGGGCTWEDFPSTSLFPFYEKLVPLVPQSIMDRIQNCLIRTKLFFKEV